MRLLDGKDVMVGVIDVASDVIETPEQVAETIGRALRYVPADRLFPCTNCGLAPMRREVAEAKLAALGTGRRAGARTPRSMSAAAPQRADDAARRRSRPRCASRATPSSRRPTSRASPARESPSSTRCGRRGTSCRPMRTCATAAATGAAATRASSSTAGDVRLVPQRAHWQPIEYNALHGGLERWFEPIEAERRSPRRRGARVRRWRSPRSRRG